MIQSVMHEKFKDKLKEYSSKGEIPIKKARIILGHYGVTKDLFLKVIKEMEKMDYLTIDRRNIKIKERWFN